MHRPVLGLRLMEEEHFLRHRFVFGSRSDPEAQGFIVRGDGFLVPFPGVLFAFFFGVF